MTTTQTTSQSAADAPNMIDIIKDALEAKGRLPAARPKLPHNPHRHDVSGFHLEARLEGWAAIITFEGVEAGLPNSLGTPDAVIYPSKQEAFMAGAETLCRILTGSTTLPFFVLRDELIVAGYGTGGFSGMFIMTRPVPWI